MSNRSAKHVALMLVANFVHALFAFGTSVIVARALGPELKGMYTYLLFPISFGLPLATLGFDAGVRYLVAKRRYSPEDVIVTAVFGGFLVGTLAFLVIAPLWLWGAFGQTARQIDASMAMLFLLLLPLRGVITILDRVLVGDSRFKELNLRKITLDLLLFASVFVFIFIMGGKLVAMLWCYAANTFLMMLLLGRVLHRLYLPRVSLDTEFAKEAIGYGIRGHWGVFTKKANLRLDHLFLGSINESSSLGVYSVSTSLSEYLWRLENAFGPVFFNRIVAAKNDAEKEKLLGRVFRLSTLIFVFAAAVLGLVSYFLIPVVYGLEYIGAVPLLLILLPGSVLACGFRVINKFFAASGRPTLVSISQALAALAAIVIYPLSVMFGGATGAAIATTAIYGLTSFNSVVILIICFPSAAKQLVSVHRLPKDFEWALNAIKTLRKDRKTK